MFKLKGTIARNASTHLDDSLVLKSAMTALGYYDDTYTGLSPYGDNQLFHSITSFQKDNNLQIDGVIHPEGSTQERIKKKLQEIPQALGAFKSFVKNYEDMVEANTINADKYFHCKANYEASKKGWRGKVVAKNLSDAREFYRQIKGDPKEDEIEDQAANMHGRWAAESGKYTSAEDACTVFRPEALDEKY